MRKRGFTLVEILIVVIILGILAAVVIPQFSDASNDTRESSVMTDLKTIRSQIQLYKAQHLETYPDDFGNQMTLYTDVDGNTNASYTSTFRFGPYMLRIPPNPWTGVDTVTTVTGAATAYAAAADMTFGWWYNDTTGEFRAHVPDSVVTANGTQVNSL